MGGVELWNFHSHTGPMLTKMEKNVLEIWWISNFLQHLALIHLRKRVLRTDGRPRHGISSADTVTQS